MNEMNAPDLAWHYAPWATLPAIVRSGALMPGGGGDGELPMLWFSRHPVWEPSATKSVRLADGGTRRMTRQEQKATFGCIRFGLPAADPRLAGWTEACRLARIGYTKRRKIEDAARRIGANPADWLGSAEGIPLVGLRFQVLLEVWSEGDMSALARLWTEKRG